MLRLILGKVAANPRALPSVFAQLDAGQHPELVNEGDDFDHPAQPQQITAQGVDLRELGLIWDLGK
jgi:hypothetical protein